MISASSAGRLLHQARVRAGLSQSQLARSAGVAQSVVSAYESGRRQPSLPTLAKLIGATGHDVDLVLRTQGTSHGRLNGPLGRVVQRRRAELRKIAAKYGVSNLRLFGSVARGEESANSDVDLLADLSPGTSLFTLARLRRDLEGVLGAPVDIVPASDLKPAVRPEVERDLVPL